MQKGQFDADAFFDALEKIRNHKKLHWKNVADEAGVSPSTLTRMAQGKRPDVDTLAALAAWANLKVDNFIHGGEPKESSGNVIEEVAALFRADPSLSPDAKSAIEAIVRVAHEKLKA
ncbi:MAG: helix-turn-helix transcriptional regulator [Pseudomonadota bacterium]